MLKASKTRCLGGNNYKENLVLLNVKEHFLCHWLLTKMVYRTKAN